MGILFTNDANSTLRTAVNSSVTTVVVASGDGALFPQPVTGADYFMLVLEDRTKNPIVREICKCTARSTDSLTVVRAQESTAAQAFAAGVIVSHRITAGTLRTLTAGGTQQTQLYLGSFATAPSAGTGGVVLIPGNLYFNTTSHTMFVWNGAIWSSITPGNSSNSYGVYLGAFGSAPLTMLDGSALVAGTLYFDTSQQALFEWDGSAWNDVSSSTTGSTNTSNSIDGNLVVSGNVTIGRNLSVGEDIACNNITVHDTTKTTTLYLDGNLVVDVGDVSGGVNFQNFPAGTVFQAGFGVTGSDGTDTINFPETFGTSPIVVVTLVGNSVNACIKLLTAAGTSSVQVFAEDTNNDGGLSAAYNWMAFGLQSDLS